MSEWEGKFHPEDEQANEQHEAATTREEREKSPLPDRVTYYVPPEMANRLRNTLRLRSKRTEKNQDEEAESSDKAKQPKTVGPHKTATLVEEHLVSVTYLDVGCWGGSAETADDTEDGATAHWGKKRYFGIVYGRLSVLCAYQPWNPRGDKVPKIDKDACPLEPDPKETDEYKKIKPLLKHLSTDPHLGVVVVLKAILNYHPGQEAIPDDRIHVILGDLHAPVMTEEDRTYSDRPRPPRPAHPATRTDTKTSADGAPHASAVVSSGDHGTGRANDTSIKTTPEPQQPWASIGAPSAPKVDTSWATSTGRDIAGASLPTATNPIATKDDRRKTTETGLPQPPPGGALAKYPLRGRYDRGDIATVVVPIMARLLDKKAKVLIKESRAGAWTRTGIEGSNGPAIFKGGVSAVATTAALLEIAVKSKIAKWSDDDAVDVSVAEDWFERYHGKKAEHGKPAKLPADIFDSAGDDLCAWLKMLKTYQGTAGPMKATSERPPIQLIQVGDLFDFWIGLKCPFDLLKTARDFPNPAVATEFVNYWLQESLRNPAINLLWNFDEVAPKTADELKTVILYGNHDTYMGTDLLRYKEAAKGRVPLPGEWTSSPQTGLVVQHGHQDDAFNSEDGARWGYLLTQSVFMDNYVRKMDSTMSSLKTKLFGGLWTRLGYAEAAVMKCLFDRIDEPEQNHATAKHQPPVFGSAHRQKPARLASTFVMGHTHEPALQLIDVVLRVSQKPAVSEPPQEIPLPKAFVVSPGQDKKAKVTISFMQVHFLKGDGKEQWDMVASIRSVADEANEATATLLDNHPIRKDNTEGLGAARVEASIGPHDKIELQIQARQVPQGSQEVKRPQYSNPLSFEGLGEGLWNAAGEKVDQLTPDFLKQKPQVDVVSVSVHPNTWEGIKTLGCDHFLVTFDLQWN